MTVLDVRPADEYRSGHISGALSIPLRARLRARMTELPVAKEVVAYCRGPYCVLSVEAAAILRGEGFRVRRLDGGMPDWVDQGLGVTGECPSIEPVVASRRDSAARFVSHAARFPLPRLVSGPDGNAG